MLGIIRIALQRPLTFIVMAVMILIFGGIAAVKTPADIFPDIKVPAIAVAWQYTGLSANDLAARIMTPYERTISTLVNDIEHSESNSIAGIGISRIFFQPNVDIRLATAQMTATAQTIVKGMPTGTTPPLIINYSASTVPIVQLALSSDTLSEQQMLDAAQNAMRPAIANVPGAASPNPYGGKNRQILLDLDVKALQAKGLSAQDVSAAIAAQSQQTPAGQAKIGAYQYTVHLNDTPEAIEDLNNLPIKTVNGATIYIRDVAHVRDGAAPQTNIVHVNGRRSVLMTIFKSGSTSTIAIVDGIKNALPHIQQLVPPGLKIIAINDQSLFVKAALEGVVREGVLAAALTSLMILLFLGSWRSTVIIAASIPLAVLSAVALLSAFGQTLNIMTLGGLALAVGILVDDATVTIENINWHLEHGKEVKTAILDGGRQIVAPAFVSLLCICVVFVPMFALKGVAGFLFVPMALSVIFAMISSFILSRTFVPTMAMYLLRQHAAHDVPNGTGHAAPTPTRNPFALFQRGFEARFTSVREGYRNLLAMAMVHRKLFIVALMGFVVLSFGLAPFLGSNFFPSVDTGQIIMHVRAPVGTRLEETSAIFGRIETEVRGIIPPKVLTAVVDNIGVPNSSINLAYSNSGVIGPSDGDIYLSLDRKGGKATADYVRTLREELPRRFPGVVFSFLPADIVSQILNFGSPSPLDIQLSGPNRAANQALAMEIMGKIRGVRGAADVRLQQSSRNPQFRVDVDRSRIGQMGLTERDVTNSLGNTLAGSSQSAPLFWLSPTNGVVYPIVTQTPEYNIASLSDLANVPITGAGRPGVQVLGGLASITREQGNAVVSHYNITPAFDIYTAVQDRDLGGVAADVQKVLDQYKDKLPRGSVLTLRGQIDTMNTAFSGLFLGLAGAIVLIYLIIVVNFQSWIDPFVIITALPAALAGIVWTLFATGTTLSVPALTGAIMCMGVATANSILVVSFARERLAEHGDPMVAAVEAGFTRFRPVLMTAMAMIIGMLPMALAWGEGGEQNAPLGRAVIGGLIFATAATLFFVPVVFSLVHGRKQIAPASEEPDEEAFAGEAAYAAQ
jgi:multidrug efflux pump subunit AcrB